MQIIELIDYNQKIGYKNAQSQSVQQVKLFVSLSNP